MNNIIYLLENLESFISELGRKYNERTLRRFRQFYNLLKEEKWSPVATKLTCSHYCEILLINDINKINYYLKIASEQLLSKRDLRVIIKSNEYDLI